MKMSHSTDSSEGFLPNLMKEETSLRLPMLLHFRLPEEKEAMTLEFTAEQGALILAYLKRLKWVGTNNDKLLLSLSGRMTDPDIAASLPLNIVIEMEARVTKMEVTPDYTELR
jgi:hypothetical protein